MKRNLKFLTLTLLILLAQNSLAAFVVTPTQWEDEKKFLYLGLAQFEPSVPKNSIIIGITGESLTSDPFSPRKDSYIGGNYSAAFGVGNKIGYMKDGVVIGGKADNSTAIGRYNNIEAGLTDVDVFGSDNSVVGAASYSSVFGKNNTVTAKENTVVGNKNHIRGNYSAAFGVGNKIGYMKNGVFVIGGKADGSTAIGRYNNIEVDSTDVDVFGSNNSVVGAAFYSSVFGKDNTVTAKENTVVGNKNNIGGNYSAAFGVGNKIGHMKNDVVTWGKADNSTAIGRYNNIEAGLTDVDVFGSNNLVAGEASYSSVFGRSNTVRAKENTVVGNNNNIGGNYSAAFGVENKIGYMKNGVVVTGGKADNSTAIGRYNNIEAGLTDVDVFGSNNLVTGAASYSSVFGRNNIARTDGNTVVGSGNNITSGAGSNAIFGNANTIGGKRNLVLGSYNRISEDANNFNIVIGDSVLPIKNNTEQSVVLGYKSKSAGSNTVSVGSTTNKRRIAYVADAVEDSDAVTKRQMNDAIAAAALSGSGIDLSSYTKKDGSNLSAADVTSWKTKLGVGSGGGTVDAYTKAESNNKFLDKTTYTADKATFATKTELGAKVNKDGSNLSATDIAAWKAKLAVAMVSGIVNTATGTNSTGLGHGNVVTGNESTAVGYKNQVSGNNSGAFGDPNIVTGHRSYAFGNDNTIAGNDNFVMGSNVNIAAGITNSVALGNNSAVTSSNEVSVGSATLKRKITNIADGEVSATSTDAVNGRQLYNAMQNSGTVGIQNLRKEVREAKDEMRGIGSLSAALSALHPMQYDPQAPNQIMAGVGTYRSKYAIAVGLTHYFKENVMMTAGVALSNERKTNAMANVGLTWKLGKGGSSSPTNTPTYIMQEELARLTRENKVQAKENQELKERVKNLEEKLEIILNKK